MKSLILLSALLFGICLNAGAQLGTCTPDTTYQDSLTGIYPLPFHPINNPLGGINDTVCLNQDFEFVFNTVLGDSIEIAPGYKIPLDSLFITGVDSMPAGFDYNCHNSECRFLKGEVGCAVIFGKTTNPQDVGRHNLTISAVLFSYPLQLPLVFPNTSFYPGNYYLWVKSGTDPYCLNNTREVAIPFERIRSVPNPFYSGTTIEIQAESSDRYLFQVSDFLGRVVHTQPVRISEGLNRIAFDGSALPEGLYFYTFSNERFRVTRKMQLIR